MKPFLLEPLDILFFRDGRPMAAGQGTGHGCRLPLPSTLHEALRTSLLSTTDFAPGQGGRGTRDKRSDRDFEGNTAFQSLRTRGPFLHGFRQHQPGESDEAWEKVPAIHKEPNLRLPLPAEVVVTDEKRLATLQLLADSAAAPFTCLPVSPVAASKDKPEGFWTPKQFATYLVGDGTDFRPLHRENLFESEPRIGVEIEDATQASKGGQLYAGSYLRPREQTRFWFEAEITDTRREEELAAFEQLDFILLGGDRRLARVWNHTAAPTLEIQRPDFQQRGLTHLKWTLLSPAIFSGGWRPNWVADERDERGFKLWLKQGWREKGVREATAAYRDFIRALPRLDGVRLTAICHGKPQAVTGWDLQREQPKPTQLAVPAGSVFYFDCDTPATTEALAVQLHLRTRSDAFGEKGFGLGVCGVWQPFRTS